MREVNLGAGPNRRSVLTLFASLPFNVSRLHGGIAEVMKPALDNEPGPIEKARGIKGALVVGNAALSIVETAAGIERRSLFMSFLAEDGSSSVSENAAHTISEQVIDPGHH